MSLYLRQITPHHIAIKWIYSEKISNSIFFSDDFATPEKKKHLATQFWGYGVLTMQCSSSTPFLIFLCIMVPHPDCSIEMIRCFPKTGPVKRSSTLCCVYGFFDHIRVLRSLPLSFFFSPLSLNVHYYHYHHYTSVSNWNEYFMIYG